MKYAFATPEWIALLQGALGHCLAVEYAKSPDFRISFCEVIYNVPAGYGATNGELAWSAHSEGRKLNFALVERDDVASKIRADFTFVQTVAHLDADDPAQATEMAALGEAAHLAGKLDRLVVNDKPRDHTVHNVIARETAAP